MNRRPLAASLAAMALAVAGPARAQATGQEPAFTEKVEVRVRSVLASITDANGAPLARPPSPAEVVVLENGKPVEVIAVEPVRRRAPQPEAPATEPGTAANAVIPPPAPLRQYLYTDAVTLQASSLRKIAAAFAADLPEILSSGPLEIVLADPTPRVLAASTTDSAALGAALEALGKMQGKESINYVRRDYLDVVQNPALAYGQNRPASLSAPRMPAKASVQHEVQLLQKVLSSIAGWAGTLPYDRPGIVYLCSDGFDADPTEFYRRTLLASQNPELRQEASTLLAEYGNTVARSRTLAEKELAARGLRTVVVALGGIHAEFASSAANTHKVSSRSIAYSSTGAEVSYFARPIEPLQLIAAATGGEVVSTETKLAAAVGRDSGLYLVTFRTTAPADGTAHALSVSGATPGLTVSAPRYLAAGTIASSAAAKATEAVSSARPSNEGLQVDVSVEATGKAGKKLQGELSVSADLAGISAALERLGAGRVRVTVAVEVPGSPPFVSHDEADLDHSGSGTIWLYEARILWPPEATRVAVTIEELKTGARGTGVADLPKLP